MERLMKKLLKNVFKRPVVGSTTPKTTPKTTPQTTSKTTPKTTSKTTPKTTPKHCNDFESVLRGTSLEICKLIMQQPSITVDGLATATGFTRNGIKYHIKRLKALVGLRRIGGRRAGKWKIPSSDE